MPDHPDRENALLKAGRIIDLAMSLPDAACLATYESPGLRPDYRTALYHLLLLRRAVAPAEEAPGDG